MVDWVTFIPSVISGGCAGAMWARSNRWKQRARRSQESLEREQNRTVHLEITIDAFKAEIVRLEQDLAIIKRQQNFQPVMGPPGPMGPRGPKIDEAELEKILRDLMSKDKTSPFGTVDIMHVIEEE